ncbi:hypothetical protein lerEdw1_007422 [Lerista edwardsae]|nr:hypothetical protein lerEdw1_007422 [Lerista edwardsae]
MVLSCFILFPQTIQIIIGLIHIGFGGVEAVISTMYYVSVATIGGYPFWGGIFFIVSGSLSVSSEKNPSVLKCNVGFNILSAIMALVGIILYVTELAINKPYYGYPGYETYYIGVSEQIPHRLDPRMDMCERTLCLLTLLIRISARLL